MRGRGVASIRPVEVRAGVLSRLGARRPTSVGCTRRRSSHRGLGCDSQVHARELRAARGQGFVEARGPGGWARDDSFQQPVAALPTERRPTRARSATVPRRRTPSHRRGALCQMRPMWDFGVIRVAPSSRGPVANSARRCSTNGIQSVPRRPAPTLGTSSKNSGARTRPRGKRVSPDFDPAAAARGGSRSDVTGRARQNTASRTGELAGTRSRGDSRRAARPGVPAGEGRPPAAPGGRRPIDVGEQRPSTPPPRASHPTRRAARLELA